MAKRPLILCILDGFANNKEYEGNAVYLAKKPNLDRLFNQYSGIQLKTWGEAVGLPEGQMGNSEVGHSNIGGGRIVYQSLTRVNKAIREGAFQKNNAFLEAINYVNKNKSILHLMGLYSPGGVHSLDKHLQELIKLAKKHNVQKVHLHLFLDGRDVPPMSADKDIEKLVEFLKSYPNYEIASISGRYYAMDRDKRWDRTKLAFDAMVFHKGKSFDNPIRFIQNSYQKKVGDEFVIPGYSKKIDSFNNNDAVIFFNFRPDRAIQICHIFTNQKYDKQPNNLYFVTMMYYGSTVKPDAIAFPLEIYSNFMGEILAKNKLTQLRIAETEKYAHVTFFFDGLQRIDYPGEKKILIHSPKVATYDLKPEMSAYEITDNLIKEMENFDVVILNFANCDMVGHTGSIPATIKAVETVDACVEKIYEKCLSLKGTLIITADHGNADEMLDEKGNIVTKHSKNLVPFYILKKDIEYSKKIGKLADIAPTMLTLLGIQIPQEMTGDVLITNN